jgi:hypothetical protein
MSFAGSTSPMIQRHIGEYPGPHRGRMRISDHFGIPAWPATMVMARFSVEEMNRRKVPHSLVGRVFGIACTRLAAPLSAEPPAG